MNKLITENLVELNHITNSNSLWVDLPAEFSGITALSYKRQFDDMYYANSNVKDIYLDFSNTTSIDSCAIGSLVQIIKFIKSEEVNFKTLGVNENVYAALEVTGLIDVINLSKSEIN